VQVLVCGRQRRLRNGRQRGHRARRIQHVQLVHRVVHLSRKRIFLNSIGMETDFIKTLASSGYLKIYFILVTTITQMSIISMNGI